MNLLGWVLAVPVDLNRDIVAFIASDAEAGLHRSPDSEIAGQRDQAGAGSDNHLHRIIRRPVVDDHDLIQRVERSDAIDKPGQRTGFIKRGHDN